MGKNSAKIRLLVWSIVAAILVIFLINITIDSDRIIYKRGIPVVNIYSNDSELTEINEYSFSLNDDIKTLKIDLTVDEIIIEETDEEEIKIIEKTNLKLNEDEEIKINQNKNILEITRNDKKKIVSMVNNINRKVEIYIPTKYKDNISISNHVGDININYGLNLDTLEIAQYVGDININSSITCNKFYTKNSIGNIKIEYLDCDRYDIASSIGDIKIKSISGYGSINTKIGSIHSGIDAIKGDINITTNVGDTKITVNENENFELDLECNIGDFKSDISFNEYKQDGKSISAKYGNSPSYVLRLRKSIGDIRINTN